MQAPPPPSERAAPAVTSPCIGVCELDMHGVCLGCYRSGEEITVWRQASDEARLAILERAQRRRQQGA